MGWKRFPSWFPPAPRRRFTLHESVAQMGQVRTLGPMSKVMGMIPGMRALVRQTNIGEREVELQMDRMKAIYNSMTEGEREEPGLLTGSRRSRIAGGAGVRTRDVLSFLRQFEISRELMDRVRGPY